MRILLTASLAALAVLASAAPETWTQSYVGVGNTASPGTGVHGLDSAFSTGAPSTASASQSFMGLDANRATQTMSFSGTTTDSAEFGRLHSYTTGTLTNSYYNAANPVYVKADGTVDPNGSPDNLESLGFAGFNDTLQFGGVLQAGYKARYIFHLDGTNTGEGYLADLGVTIGSDATDAFFASDPGFNEVDWATGDHLIDGTNPQTISVQFSTQVVFNTFDRLDGSNGSGTCDFGSTLTLAGIEMRDANGQIVTGWTVTSGSGTVYPQAVPEPASYLVLGFLSIPLLRRRVR